MTKHMMLSKKLDDKNTPNAFLWSRKYDGVPVVIYWDKETEKVRNITRNGTELTSIQHILDEITELYMKGIYYVGRRIVGELVIHDTDFKDISGKARADAPCEDLQLYVFDSWIPDVDEPFLQRYKKYMFSNYISFRPKYIVAVPQIMAVKDDLDRLRGYVLDNKWEGIILRALDDVYSVGKRSKGYLKYKPEPTLDLRCIGFEEALSKDKVPKGMVGALICEYNGSTCKVGAGSMKHTERKEVWDNQEKYIGNIAEVGYMYDDSYTSLRQPVFKNWRFDKLEVD